MTDTPVYLDYQATTPIDPAVREAMMPFLGDLFGNPHSSDHSFGREASNAIKHARKQVADFVNADDDEIVFTSGATESCNLALRGAATRPGNGRRDRIVTLATEHPAVYETVLDLGRSGFDAVVLPVAPDGLVNLTHLDKVLDERTLLVSVMAVNNEIGVIQPIAEIAARCRAAGALFHTDATQAAGRMAIDVDEWNVDLMSLSSHKVYGPKGAGALFVRSGVKLRPIITGGSQEDGLRGGTLAPALIAGFGAACGIASTRQEGDRARMEALTKRLYTGLRKACPSLRLFGNANQRVAGSLNVGIAGVPALEAIDNISGRIAVSSGAACASATTKPSRVLLALGLDEATANTGIRISLGRFTTETDIDTAIATLSRISSAAHRT